MSNSAFTFGAKLAAVTLASPPKHNDTAGIDVNPVAAGTPEGKETLTKKKVPVKAEDVVTPSKAAYFGAKLAGQVNFYERVPKDEKKRKNPASLNPSAAGENPIPAAEEPAEQEEFNIKGAFAFGAKLAQIIPNQTFPTMVPDMSGTSGNGAVTEKRPHPMMDALDRGMQAVGDSDLGWALGEGARHYGGKLQDFGASLAEKMKPYTIPTEAFTNPGSDPVFGGTGGGNAAPSGPSLFDRLRPYTLSADAFTGQNAPPPPEGWTRDPWTGTLSRERSDYQPNKLEFWDGRGTPPGSSAAPASEPAPASKPAPAATPPASVAGMPPMPVSKPVLDLPPAPEPETAPAPAASGGKSPYQREYKTETTRIEAPSAGSTVPAAEPSADAPAPEQADPIETARNEAGAAPAGEPAAPPPGETAAPAPVPGAPAPSADTAATPPGDKGAPAPTPAPAPGPAAPPPANTGDGTGSWTDYLPAGLGASGLAALAYMMMQNDEKKKKRRDDEE